MFTPIAALKISQARCDVFHSQIEMQRLVGLAQQML
jgi:hypothetical protein